MPDQLPQLDEKDFVHEGYSKDPFQLWLWLFVSLAILGLFWAGNKWYQSKIVPVFSENPFLQVTNRELSLFLWQNPEFMRINAKERGNYLPGFLYIDKVTADITLADEYAVAPPEVLFRYHTWDRLVKNEFIETSILPKKFVQFLSYDEQWLPRYWPEASADYSALVETLEARGEEDLSTLPLSVLPLDVRIAFQGWQNYFIDREALNHLALTHDQVVQFLASHPHYARNYWRNIVMEHTPNYLMSIGDPKADPNAVITSGELTGFLRVALFNYSTMQKPSG